jgi:PPOX class probable FMN-dependent enzyme
VTSSTESTASPAGSTDDGDRLDGPCRRFIALSPFLVMATTDAEGRCDASPKGDVPGFVQVPDDRTLLVPDRIGNNRLDGLANVLANPHVGLLFLLPGSPATLHVAGRARISTDPAHLAATAHAGKPPRSVLVVTVESVRLDGGEALSRSGLWDPARHVETGGFPSLARIISDQVAELGEAETAERLAQSYRDRLY